MLPAHRACCRSPRQANPPLPSCFHPRCSARLPVHSRSSSRRLTRSLSGHSASRPSIAQREGKGLPFNWLPSPGTGRCSSCCNTVMPGWQWAVESCRCHPPALRRRRPRPLHWRMEWGGYGRRTEENGTEGEERLGGRRGGQCEQMGWTRWHRMVKSSVTEGSGSGSSGSSSSSCSSVCGEACKGSSPRMMLPGSVRSPCRSLPPLAAVNSHSSRHAGHCKWNGSAKWSDWKAVW